MISGFTVERKSDGSVLLKWKPPFNKGGRDLVYVIKYGSMRKETKSTNIIIPSISSTQEYFVKVRTLFLLKNYFACYGISFFFIGIHDLLCSTDM